MGAVRATPAAVAAAPVYRVDLQQISGSGDAEGLVTVEDVRAAAGVDRWDGTAEVRAFLDDLEDVEDVARPGRTPAPAVVAAPAGFGRRQIVDRSNTDDELDNALYASLYGVDAYGRPVPPRQGGRS
jgi:pyruvate/2-oxoglutarate dehydrogenase complex dihydrolipoamide acyltransferase (E2) component